MSTVYAIAKMPLLRSPLATGLALTAAAALLFAFCNVVDQGVRNASERRVEASALASAASRCAWSKGADARASCQNALRVQRMASRQALS